MTGVADRHPADADPDPLIHCDADLDPDLFPTQIKKKIKFFSSHIRKFGMEQLQSHI
jgi:hypothetical protein